MLHDAHTHKHPTTQQELMREALILAKERDVDVFNALDLMENLEVLEDLKFGPGDGQVRCRREPLTRCTPLILPSFSLLFTPPNPNSS